LAALGCCDLARSDMALYRLADQGDREGTGEGYLVRTTTRLCIDRLRARRRREYVGP
jgi:DNA-directed RNA polymerase specialized sigma24 family protein